jgi:signal transduction histidine kinase
MLIEREALSDRAIHKVRTIVRTVDRMVDMVQRLLLYTQSHFGSGIALDKKPTDLEQVCRDAISDVQSGRDGDAIQLTIEGDCRGLWDRTRLTEVASNLIGNAVKFAPPGHPVHVVARDEGDRVALQVHNVGPPIPAELLPVIFEPLRRAENQRGSDRSFGLGLYIVREIVVAHGGTVSVRSSRTTGTLFVVRLPRGEVARYAPSP